MKTKTDPTTRRILVYLGLLFGILIPMWILSVVLPDEQGSGVYSLMRTVFTALPVAAALLTRVLTKDRSKLALSLRIWKRPGLWLFSALVPAAAILIGAIVFFLVFPGDLNGSVTSLANIPIVFENGLTVPGMLLAGAAFVVISALNIPVQLLELGEEVGWRGYLLPLLTQKMSARKAVLLSGVLWGAAHAPLIYHGFNFGLADPLAPWSGIAVMILLCVVIGTWESYVFLRSGNCMYSAILHGSVNVIGEIGVSFSNHTRSMLLGPNPGLVSGCALFAGAAVLFVLIGRLPAGKAGKAE